MTGDQIYLLRKSFEIVEQHKHVAALVFYRRLFELDPKLRWLFTTNIEEQSKKLIDMLGLALSLSERPEVLQMEVRELGARHATYGVQEEYYETVGRAMLEMLGHVLGEQFTPATRQAWTEFYDFMAETMKTGAAVAAEIGDRG